MTELYQPFPHKAPQLALDILLIRMTWGEVFVNNWREKLGNQLVSTRLKVKNLPKMILSPNAENYE